MRNTPWRGDFDGMAERHLIRVLVVYNDMFYFVDRGRQRGLAYELMKAFETFVNKKLKKKHRRLKVVFVPVARDQLLSGLIEGRGDIAVANLTDTPERRQQVDFSDPVGKGIGELVVTGPSAPTLSTLGDLAGKAVHVRFSSSYYENLKRLNVRFRKEGRPAMQLVRTGEYLEDADLLEMVNAGLIPMVVVDSHKALFWKDVFSRIRVHEDLAVHTGGHIAWAFRKRSPELARWINRFVKEYKQGTLLGNILIKRYLIDNQWIKNPLGEKEMKKYRAVVKVFKTYAERYHFDWLMLVALAYQESGLDNGRRSPAGAMGIMQISRRTASDSHVGIEHIEGLDNNVHAGTKYLRFIYDRYFANLPMDGLNKMLFTFAAYNAGPARVAGLRKETREKGLDPNVWFNNVEVAAAGRIGRETVQYVSNIYKYYIAYRMSADYLQHKQEQKAELL